MSEFETLIAKLVAAEVERQLEARVPRPSASNDNAPGGALIDDREVARRLGISRDTIQAWRLVGKGPPWMRVGGRAVRYRSGDVEAWLAAGGEK